MVSLVSYNATIIIMITVKPTVIPATLWDQLLQYVARWLDIWEWFLNVVDELINLCGAHWAFGCQGSTTVSMGSIHVCLFNCPPFSLLYMYLYLHLLSLLHLGSISAITSSLYGVTSFLIATEGNQSYNTLYIHVHVHVHV